jgi:hypothetical protein
MRRGTLLIFLDVAGSASAQDAPAAPAPDGQQEPDARPTGWPSQMDWTVNLDAGLGSFAFFNSLYTNPRDEPSGDLSDTQAFFRLHEDSPEFLARGIARSAHLYLERLLPPMSKALADYTLRASRSWPPGHRGGVAFRKSVVGRAFHDRGPTTTT